MAIQRSSQKTLVEAMQAVFEALEPFDQVSRQRIIESASSLLGNVPSQSQVPLPAQTTATIPRASTTAGGADRPLSPIELLQTKAPATNAQRIAIFAYFRERVEGSPRFAKEDLKTYFPKAKLPPPANYDRDFKQAVTLGWIYEDGADSYLTSKGLEAVEAGFGGKGLKPGPKTGAKKSKAKKRR